MAKSTRVTSRSSRKPAGRRKPAIDRPFDSGVLRRAREVVAGYRVTIHAEPGVGFVGECVEMPYCMGLGETADACLKETQALTVSAVATMIEGGQVPPASIGEKRRDQQLNLRLTLEEKLALEEAARQQGFRGVSDFVRSKSLASLHP